jgi:ubiquinone/menaquinone biosynthesis C-methylase UbiE
MKKNLLDKVKNFWETESCGERYVSGDDDYSKFISETDNRYKLEPYILDFTSSKDFFNKDVLEIGIGMGSDHYRIYKFKPKTLTGIDLTERAIKNTKKRFKIMKAKSNLKIDNAEKLNFKDETFDTVYSWGVLHHSADTAKCFEEVQRVLRPNGVAKIMIYYKYSPIGLMLWIRYGLLRAKPFIGFNELYSNYLESPGTKAFTISQTDKLTQKFKCKNYSIQLCFADLLDGNVGANHKGIFITIAKLIYPRFLVKFIAKLFPIGLFLLITLKK